MVKGFRKVAPERWEFTNDNFRRGHPDLLFEIKRRRNSRRLEGSTDEPEDHSISPSSSKDHDYQSFASTATTSSPHRVMDSIWLENEKLKKTNKILYQELAEAKRHNEVLLGFLSKYIDVTNLRYTAMGGGKGDKGPMLFGVYLKDAAEEETRKRGRCCEGDDGAEIPAKMIEF